VAGGLLRKDSRKTTDMAGLACRPIACRPDNRQGTADSQPPDPFMTDSKPYAARARIAPAGLMFLAITSVGWGFNWPVTKYLLSELPPLSLRGTTGVIGAGLLTLLALVRGQSLRVPREMWPRLVLAAFLNVGCWMVLMGLALLWLPASEAALIAYTMPIWASMLAWPILGERPNLLRVISLLMAFAGLAAIMGGNGFAASQAKLPGIIMALAGSIGFAVGTVLSKKLPLHLPPLTAAAWQIGIGCLPVAIVGLCVENADVAALSELGWILVFYSTVIQFCVAYVSWFAALARLPASVAAIGTMAVPVIGVVTSAIALHEPLGVGQISALVFTLAGVALATRS
jgi:drug/metabolite transporter (DMT)-like permease